MYHKQPPAKVDFSQPGGPPRGRGDHLGGRRENQGRGGVGTGFATIPREWEVPRLRVRAAEALQMRLPTAGGGSHPEEVP